MKVDAIGLLMRRILATVARRARTAVVGRVESYDPQKQTATVLPLVGEQDSVNGEGRELEPVPASKVPVMHYGSGTRGMTFGVSGPGLLVVRHRSHAEIDGGATGPATPQDKQRMSIGAGVLFPGYIPPATGQPAAHYRSDGQWTWYLPNGEAVFVGASTAAIALARADKTDAQLQEIRTLLTTWVPVPNDGGAALKAAALAQWSDPSPSTETTRIKVDT